MIKWRLWYKNKDDNAIINFAYRNSGVTIQLDDDSIQESKYYRAGIAKKESLITLRQWIDECLLMEGICDTCYITNIPPNFIGTLTCKDCGNIIKTNELIDTHDAE